MTPPAGPSNLDALLAALAELGPTDRAPALRSYLEYTLELAQANDSEHFTFLSECALLAVDSMQDVRLENVELLVEALRNPPAKEWGEAITDVALTLAMQAAILLALETAVAGVILVAGHRVLSVARRTVEADLLAARSANTALADRMAALRLERAQLTRQETILARGGYTHAPDELDDIKPGPLGGFEPFDSRRLDDAVQQYQRITDELVLLYLATPRTAARVVRAQDMYESVAANGVSAADSLKRAWGENWRNLIGGEKGGVIVAVSQAVVEGALAASAASTAAPSGQPFLASEVAGRFLDWAAEERLGVSQTYANLRRVLRATSDEDLVAGDDYVVYLAQLGTEVLQRQQEVRQRYRAARPAVVRGFEAVFWREYLQANGVLKQEDPAPAALIGFGEPGALLGDHLILERFQDDPATHETTAAGAGEVRYRTQRYPGAGRIPDLLAANLFRRFAAPHYADKDRAKTLAPFRYEPGKYTGAKIPAADDFWGYPDPAGLRLVDEMRFLVVRFFRDGIPDQPENLVTTALAAATDAAAAAAKDPGRKPAPAGETGLAQAVGTETGGRDPADATASSRGAEAWFAAMAAVTPPAAGSPMARDLAELRLTVALTDLNQDMQAYVLLDRGALEAEETVGQRSKEQLLVQIELERQAVKASWMDLQAQAGDQRDRLVETFQAAIDAVDRWQPGHGWVWYGPDQPRP